MNGLIFIDRAMLNHPVVGIKNPQRFVAWCWLLSEASWKARRKEVDGRVIDLQRGQLTASLSFMADGIGMTVKQVRVFLDRLEREGMIVRDRSNTGQKPGIAKGTGQTVITICNYDKYQDVEIYRAKPRAKEGQSRGKAGARTRKPDALPDEKPEEDSFDQFWSLYPRRVGKGQARKAFATALKKTDLETILNGVRQYVAFKPGYADYAHPSSWLNGERWSDEYTTDPQQPEQQGTRKSGSILDAAARFQARRAANGGL